jgi:hypothetical protein
LVTILAVFMAVEVSMTSSANTAIAAGFIGAFGLGVWTAPHVRNIDMDVNPPVEQVEMAEPVAEPRTVRDTPVVVVRDRSESYAPVVVLEASAAPVQKHVKPLLTWGTDTQKAAEGFTSAEEFVTVAHAAKNTQVPFILLKHRVLNEKKSLEAAIRASKPELDAALEADRARLEARADLARMSE